MRTIAIVAALTLCGFSAADWRYTPDWAQADEQTNPNTETAP